MGEASAAKRKIYKFNAYRHIDMGYRIKTVFDNSFDMPWRPGASGIHSLLNRPMSVTWNSNNFMNVIGGIDKVYSEAHRIMEKIYSEGYSKLDRKYGLDSDSCKKLIEEKFKKRVEENKLLRETLPPELNFLYKKEKA
jgi:hypothetical protein